MSWARARLMMSVALLLTALCPGARAADGDAPPDAQLVVTIEAPVPQPYEQELILVRVHGAYADEITLESLEQPPLKDFSWMQLGRDKWGEATVGSRQMKTYDRVMAVFAGKAGRLEIEPFTHHLTVIGGNGSWQKLDVRSEPVAVDIKPGRVGQGRAPSWWLPARALKLTDVFDRETDGLRPGETVTRTVTLEAEGVSADALPPAPRLRAPGILAFPDPEERSTRITDRGPVSTVVWRWTLRPTVGQPVTTGAVEIAWFDTIARQPKTVVLAPKRFAMRVPGAQNEPLHQGWASRHHRALQWMAMALGFLVASRILLAGLRLRRRTEGALWPPFRL